MIKSKAALIQMRRLMFLARHAMLPLYMVDGEFEGEQLRALVADDGSTLDYVCEGLFPKGMRISRNGTINAFRATSLKNSSADIVVVGTNQLFAGIYARHGFYVVPKWIRAFIPLTDHPDQMISRFNRSARRDIKYAKDSGFVCETVTDAGWIDHFYYDIYKPYILGRFSTANISPYKEVRNDYLKGAGLVIKADGEPVACAIVYKEGSIMRTPYLGLVAGKDNPASKGVTGAIYYHAMLQAYSWGCTGVNFGHNRAFLSDGVLRYKLKWGMDILDDDDGTASFAIATPGSTKQAQKLLGASGFYHIKNGSVCLYGDNSNES